ncbi:MAG: HEPN domain-containing protein [Thaumarchaeota archaeon]|nr:HEPN domain-containing protein [Nitrososphaerota archaeon]
MSFRESAILRKRARTFLRHAGESVKTKEFDFACFSAEQAAQLFVKSAIHRRSSKVSQCQRDAGPACELFAEEQEGHNEVHEREQEGTKANGRCVHKFEVSPFRIYSRGG